MKTLLVHNDVFSTSSSSKHAERAVASLRSFETRVTVVNDAPEVDLRWVRVVHEGAYLSALRSGDSGLWTSALHACGAVCTAVDHVMLGTATHRAFCAVEPSGHQAGRASASSTDGVVGAKYALLRHELRRIAVVDFDIHHGLGSEELLSGDDNFLYVGLHRAPDETPEAEAPSASNIVSFKLPASKSRAAFPAAAHAMLQRLREFSPELIFISAGFDGHKNDALGLGALLERDYFALTAQLCELADECCQGRVVSVLEGGYDLLNGGLIRSVEAHVLALMAPPELRPLLLQAALAPQARWGLASVRSNFKAHMEGVALADAAQNTIRVARKRERVVTEAYPLRLEEAKKTRTRLDVPEGDGEGEDALEEENQDEMDLMLVDDAEDDDDEYYAGAEPNVLEPGEQQQHSAGAASDGGAPSFQVPGPPQPQALQDDDDLVVDILDDDAMNEDSQEGTAREGLDLQLDYELSERSYTEAVESKRPTAAPPSSSSSSTTTGGSALQRASPFDAKHENSHSSGGGVPSSTLQGNGANAHSKPEQHVNANVRGTVLVTDAAARNASGSEEVPRTLPAAVEASVHPLSSASSATHNITLDFDEINALIGEELGEL